MCSSDLFPSHDRRRGKSKKQIRSGRTDVFTLESNKLRTNWKFEMVPEVDPEVEGNT